MGNDKFVVPVMDHVLMSDSLKGQVPVLEGTDAQVQQQAGEHVLVVTQKVVGQTMTGIVGILRGIVLGADPEIEFRIELVEALQILQASGLSFPGFELHHGLDTVVKIPGPFIVKEARIDEISTQEQLCTLGLHLVKPAR